MAEDLQAVRTEVQEARLGDAGRKAQDRRVGRLLGPTRSAAKTLFAEDRNFNFRQPGTALEIAEQIDALSDGRRAKLFRAISPDLGEFIDALWRDGVDQPFPIGGERRGFRSPGDRRVTAASRVQRLRGTGRWAAQWERDIGWLAKHGGHVDPGWTLGPLLAAALDHGPPKVAAEVEGHLLDQLHGRGVPGAMGRHVPMAMLGANRPDLWDQVEALLLGAQRQEGIRQSVLEAVDLAHPAAFSRFLAAIAEHGLTRFAATARAAGVWLGEPFEARDRKLLDDLLGRVAPLVLDPSAAGDAAQGDDATTVRLALWALATRDASASARVARARQASGDPEIRLVAARHLASLGPVVDADGMYVAVADDDERVRGVALDQMMRWTWAQGPVGPPVMDALLTLHARESTKRKVAIGTWKPVEVEIDPRSILDAAVQHLGDRSPLTVEHLVADMSPVGRAEWARQLAKDARAHRPQLLGLIGDKAEHPRRIALDAIGNDRLDPSEAPPLEHLLRRSSADLRRGVLVLLLSQPDAAAVASAQRLLTGTTNQASAGRELVAELTTARRGGASLTALAADAGKGQGSGTGTDAAAAPAGQRTWADVAADAKAGRSEAVPAPTAPAPPGTSAPRAQPRVEVRSLIDHDARTPSLQPTRPGAGLDATHVAAAGLAISSMSAWLAEHADLEVTIGQYGGGEQRVMLLSDVRWIQRLLAARPWQEQAARLPLPDVVNPWWERTAGNLDPHGVGLVLAVATLDANGGTNPNQRRPGGAPTPSPLISALSLSHPGAKAVDEDRAPITQGLITWVAAREATTEGVEALLDLAQRVLSQVPDKTVRKMPTVAAIASAPFHKRDPDWRDEAVFVAAVRWAAKLESLRPEVFSSSQRARLVRMLRWLDEPQGLRHNAPTKTVKATYRGLSDRTVPDRPARRPLPLRLLCRAVEDGAATRADVVELLVGGRASEDHQGFQAWDDNRQHPLSEATRRALPADLGAFPWLREEVDQVREAILDIELARGELPTPVSDAATKLRTVIGTDRVLHALRSLGSQSFVRGYIWGGSDSKKGAISKLVRVAFPAPDDTAEDFAALAKAAKLTPARLTALAVYAPQWAPMVEHTIARPGLADAIRWLHAHTKDDRWQVDADVRAEWMAQVQEQTPLTAEDLVAGTVDVAWFGRIRETLGDEHFTALLKAAKYASSSGGHKRAELFAQALRGEVQVEELMGRAEEKRHQDSVRAIGLVPLPGAAQAARAEVLSRWQWLQEWSKGSRQFGQQKRASEALAVRVATDNLARTAGYADPQRLTWAMEAEAVRDLAAGPLTAMADDVTVTLSIDADGAPTLAVDRAGKSLKNVPKKVARDEGIAELKDRMKGLREQARRMRRSLEDAMVRGDTFAPAEFSELREHAVLRPMLEALVVIDEHGTCARPSGNGFVAPTGSAAKLRGDLRIAHPVDLLASGTWHDWQHALFQAKVRQPCKQVFRELYVLTQAERDHGHRSRRYAGQQVQPSQATALFGARGWVVSPEGEVLKTFHDEDVTAHVTIMLGAWGTPSEVEDQAVEDLVFTRRGSWEPIALDQVPPRLFSEVMRDLDLVVSVAHSGGYDPEASASSIEVRGAIVAETADLLSLDNVETTGHHAMIRGALGNYSVHLGSGTVHKRPGNAVCIIPVGAQQRGRIFLPFVDDDPRTAEIVSKVVLLARDDKIKDPSILDQLR